MSQRNEQERSTRAARQLVETSRLLGVDFVPVRMDIGEAESESEPELERVAPPAEQKTESNEAAPADRREQKRAALDALCERHAAECPHCTQAEGWTNMVFGDGNPDARLMFVGEAPGAEEDRQGIPFVGRSGQKLNEMITAMGLSREEVYIANVLKTRPPNNATPTTTEADRCGVYLREQVAIIQPDVIVSLGKPAAQLLLNSREAMGRMRGRWHEYEGIPVMPTFHPAFLLRQYTPENRQKVWSDLKQAMERLPG